MTSLTVVIDRLKTGPNNFAVWITEAPLPVAITHHDQPWSERLTQAWLCWEEIFSEEKSPRPPFVGDLSAHPGLSPGEGGKLMQELGIGLWRWLFSPSLGQSLAISQGVAAGNAKPLRIRLEVRDRYLGLLPWEIMQSEVNMQPVSVSHNILFSRTSSRVTPLALPPLADCLRILLVAGEDSCPESQQALQLRTEIDNIVRIVKGEDRDKTPIIDVLIRPTTQELIETLDRGNYNAFFYGGHGEPHQEGGLLKFGSGTALTGIELGQVLVRNRVILCVFNTCWGAKPALTGDEIIERSSLAEALIAGGVPAVLGMRDRIADREALTFISTFSKDLSEGLPIDQAVRHARGNLLSTYRFNQPAWTLPILYMHPNFDGQIIQSADNRITTIPGPKEYPSAYLKAQISGRIWRIEGLTYLGRNGDTNTVVIREQWVSGSHGQIVCRQISPGGTYHFSLIDNSRYGTFIYENGSWRHYYHEEIPLAPNTQIRLGSMEGETLEFILEE